MLDTTTKIVREKPKIAIFHVLLGYLLLFLFKKKGVLQFECIVLTTWACPFLPLLSPDIGKRLKTLEINGRTAKNRRPRGKFLGLRIFYCDFLYFIIFSIFSYFSFFSDTPTCSYDTAWTLFDVRR